MTRRRRGNAGRGCPAGHFLPRSPPAMMAQGRRNAHDATPPPLRTRPAPDLPGVSVPSVCAAGAFRALRVYTPCPPRAPQAPSVLSVFILRALRVRRRSGARRGEPCKIHRTCYSNKVFASIAQLVEQRIRNAQVKGSSPFAGSIFRDAPPEAEIWVSAPSRARRRHRLWHIFQRRRTTGILDGFGAASEGGSARRTGGDEPACPVFPQCGVISPRTVGPG